MILVYHINSENAIKRKKLSMRIDRDAKPLIQASELCRFFARKSRHHNGRQTRARRLRTVRL